MRKFNILFVISLLLTSCSKKGVQDIVIINKSLTLSQKASEEKGGKEVICDNGSGNSNLSIALPENIVETNFAVEGMSALSFGKQEKELADKNGFTFHNIEIPEELMLGVFTQLPITDIARASQVCRSWYQLSEDHGLWRAVRLHIYGDYPANDATKEQAKLHMLRVYVNTLSELTTMKHLISKYRLNKNRSFVRYQSLAYNSINQLSREIIDEQAIQGNQVAIEQNMKRVANGKRGYKKDPEVLFELNECLIEQGNEEAIERKINALAKGNHIYKKDCQAAIALNEYWIEQDNAEAIQRKVKGLINGFYGYKENREAGVAYNESLVEQENQNAIYIKILGLTHGIYGYNRNPADAFSLNEYWVARGVIQAIERKVEALTSGFYGYKRDIEAAVALNENLIKEGNEKAIKRRLDGLTYGKYGYQQNLEAAMELNEQLIKQGDEDAIIRKIEGLTKKNDSDAVSLYHKDLSQLKNWLEEEATKSTRWACYLVSKGLKYGILGFEKDQEAAIEYIKRYNIPY